jgi:hypothetical protein
MTNNKETEFLPEYMEETHGTRVLITNTQSDVYLERARKLKEHHKINSESVDPDLYFRWCGGQNGFDVLVERLEDN